MKETTLAPRAPPETTVRRLPAAKKRPKAAASWEAFRIAFAGPQLRIEAVFERRARIPLRVVWRDGRPPEARICADWDRYDPLRSADRQRFLATIPEERQREAERLLAMLVDRLIEWRLGSKAVAS